MSDTESNSDTQSSSDDEQPLEGLFLRRNFGQCVFCNTITSFKQHFFYCVACKDYFKALVERATTLVCNNTEFPDREECEHCALDFFYTHGMKVEDLGIRRSSLVDAEYGTNEYESVDEIPFRESFNEMEYLFIRQLDDSASDFLTWLNDQDDFACIHPVDRMTLFRRNLGRGRLMWIVCESIGVHNFIKLSYCYFNPWDATSMISREIIKCIFETAGYLSFAAMNNHMLHTLKILSILHVGPVFETNPYIDDVEGFIDVFYENLDNESIRLQRPGDIALIIENHWNMIRYIKTEYRESLCVLDQMLSCLSICNNAIENQFNEGNYPLYMTTEELTNRLMWSFKRKQSICLPDPPEVVDFPNERFCMMGILNEFYILGIEYARKILEHYVVIKDQEILLAHNLKYLVIQQLSWFFKGDMPPFVRTDKICLDIVWRLKYLYTLQSTMPFTRVSLLQMLILLRAPGSREENHPVSILERSYRRRLINLMKAEYQLRSNYRPKLRLANIMDIILDCCRYIDDNRKHLSLLFNWNALL